MLGLNVSVSMEEYYASIINRCASMEFDWAFGDFSVPSDPLIVEYAREIVSPCSPRLEAILNVIDGEIEEGCVSDAHPIEIPHLYCYRHEFNNSTVTVEDLETYMDMVRRNSFDTADEVRCIINYARKKGWDAIRFKNFWKRKW